MVALNPILQRAYEYTRNHKFLWFFGIFVSGSGFFGIYKLFNLDIRGTISGQNKYSAYIFSHPGLFAALVCLAAVLIFVSLSLSALSKLSLSVSAAALENKQEINFKKALEKSRKKFWRGLVVSLMLELLILFIALWLFVPVAYAYGHTGLEFRSIILGLVGALIFLPVFVVLSLVMEFAMNFVAIYDLPWRSAIHSGFDLLSQHWPDALALLVVLWAIFSILFFISASLLGIVGILAYLISVLLKSVLIPVFLIVKIFFIAVIGVALIFVNTLLNTYSNVAWALFFIEIVKSVPTEEESKKVPLPRPVT